MAIEDKILTAVTSGVDTFSFILWIIIPAVVLGILIWFAWFRLQFKHKIKLRHQTKGKADYVEEDVYRYVKGKGKPEQIQLWKSKDKKPCPPKKAKDLTKKGNEYVEGWINDAGEITWADLDNKPYKVSFSAIDTDDKEFYANAHFEAQRHKQRSVLDIISDNAGLIIVILFVIMVISFWSEITAPMVKVVNTQAEITEKQAEIMDRVEGILENRQKLLDEQLEGEITANNTREIPN